MVVVLMTDVMEDPDLYGLVIRSSSAVRFEMQRTSLLLSMESSDERASPSLGPCCMSLAGYFGARRGGRCEECRQRLIV